MLHGYIDSQRLSKGNEWLYGLSTIFQRWLNGYRDRLRSFKGKRMARMIV